MFIGISIMVVGFFLCMALSDIIKELRYKNKLLEEQNRILKENGNKIK